LFQQYENIAKIITRCLLKAGTADHYGGAPYLVILHDNIEDSQTVSGDPMGNQRVDQAIFYEPGVTAGTQNYKTCDEVLRTIMIAYDLCLRYVGPYFLLYKLKILATGGTGYRYDAGGDYAGTYAIGSALSIDDDKLLDANRKGISSFGVLPPLYKARITYDHGDQITNLLFGISYSG